MVKRLLQSSVAKPQSYFLPIVNMPMRFATSRSVLAPPTPLETIFRLEIFDNIKSKKKSFSWKISYCNVWTHQPKMPLLWLRKLLRKTTSSGRRSQLRSIPNTNLKICSTPSYFYKKYRSMKATTVVDIWTYPTSGAPQPNHTASRQRPASVQTPERVSA